MTNAQRLPGQLWPHQREALRTIERYLAGGEREQACLITLPTGTGKSGVIACAVGHLGGITGHRLVLTPWDALVRQLIADVQGRFWERAGISRPRALPAVRRLPARSRLDELPGRDEPTIFIATIAALQGIAREHSSPGALAETFASFDLLIVDEGHYEPAEHWSQSIRSLGLPTVLLTATPYRNDEKYFQIDSGARYRLSHHQAQEQRFLREPSFRTISRPTPDRFAQELVDAVQDVRVAGAPARVIVRCENHAAIAQVVRGLQALGEDAIGIHERFSATSGPDLRRSVPPPEEIDARFWVHQNKLIEGIDDPRFAVVAFYDALGNDRAVVQQIGRVLRNPTRSSAEMNAVVIGSGGRDPKRTWDAYMTFDRNEPTATATLPDLAERVLEAQPAVYYFARAYRTRLDLTSPDAWAQFAFTLRTRALRLLDGEEPLELGVLACEVSEEWRGDDLSVFRAMAPEPEAVVIPYIASENSPLLMTGMFIEPQLGYTVLCLRGSLLFCHDTRGVVPEAVLARARALKPAELSPLFPPGSRITTVDLLNGDLGRRAPRARSLRAAAIDELAPDLSDHAYVCTTAEGHASTGAIQVRRYLGLSRSRVVDHRSGTPDFERYSAWIDELAAGLDAQGASAPTFQRYARPVAAPADPTPTHVLLDVDPVAFEGLSDGGPLQLEDSAYEVSNGTFQIRTGDAAHPATLEWDSLRERYELACPGLQGIFREPGGEQLELIAYVNHAQALRVIPAERKEIYSHGSFYAPTIPLRRSGAFHLLDVITPIPVLAGTVSEKGSAITADDWDPACVFGLISALDPGSGRSAAPELVAALGQPDLLLCSDMGTEIADFIATAPGRVVFLHAKASGSPKALSASGLHEVCAQAVKNLAYLQPFSEEAPKAKNWMQKWKARAITGEATRLRVGSFTSTPAIWKHVRERVAAPANEREVWIVLGASLSREKLEKETRSSPPSAEALQIFSLLQSTWSTVSQLGARLRVFASP